MAAIGTALFALLRSGDHFISSSFLFGNTNSLFNTFATQGIEVTFVDATSSDAVAAAIQTNTKLVFVETIANPRTQVSDLMGIGELCREHDLVYFVDNTMTTPYLFRPKDVGPVLLLIRLTKYIGGHANALGGAVTETGLFDWSDFTNLYDNYKKGDVSGGRFTDQKERPEGLWCFAGARSSSPYFGGSDTLALRMDRFVQCAAASRVPRWLMRRSSRSTTLDCPGHPEHDRSRFCLAIMVGYSVSSWLMMWTALILSTSWIW